MSAILDLFVFTFMAITLMNSAAFMYLFFVINPYCRWTQLQFLFIITANIKMLEFVMGIDGERTIMHAHIFLYLASVIGLIDVGRNGYACAISSLRKGSFMPHGWFLFSAFAWATIAPDSKNWLVAANSFIFLYWLQLLFLKKEKDRVTAG